MLVSLLNLTATDLPDVLSVAKAAALSLTNAVRERLGDAGEPKKILVNIQQGKNYMDYKTGLSAFNHLGSTSMK